MDVDRFHIVIVWDYGVTYLDLLELKIHLYFFSNCIEFVFVVWCEICYKFSFEVVVILIFISTLAVNLLSLEYMEILVAQGI